MDDLFPETIDKGAHGASWWQGAWQCRNHHGFFQHRERGEGVWCFAVPWFANDDQTCSVYKIRDDGEIGTENLVPIDPQGRITIPGQKYGRKYWTH